MTEFSRILCVVDPTSDNPPALQRAAWLAGSSGAALELFICYYNEYLGGDQFFDSGSFKRTISHKPVFVAAVDPTHEHDKPAALDDATLAISRSLAKGTGGEVHAFHSFDPRLVFPVATANAYIPVLLETEEVGKLVRTAHEKRFFELTRSHDLDADRSHFVSGLAHQELPALAKDLSASVVVMGAIARNRLKRLFIGATAERTLEELPCDLLIVKPDWYDVDTDESDSG